MIPPMQPAMAATTRDSGIPLVDEVPWGSHLCVFYDSRDDLLDTVACYLEAGLRGNEFCVWRLPASIAIEEAHEKLSSAIDEFEDHVNAGRLELVPTSAGEYPGRAALERLWRAKFEEAIANGFEGLRGCGDSSALKSHEEAAEYEHDLHALLVDRPVIALCTYSLAITRAMDVFDIVRVHNLTVARRDGEWQFMETPELQRANARIRNLGDALAILSRPFPGHELLTDRERMVLAYLVKGASSKEAGRELGISPRTIDFHRANIIEKLGARNTADAVRRALSRD
jgi:DNA-binding CsgD family transcriptional regulator